MTKGLLVLLLQGVALTAVGAVAGPPGDYGMWVFLSLCTCALYGHAVSRMRLKLLILASGLMVGTLALTVLGALYGTYDMVGPLGDPAQSAQSFWAGWLKILPLTLALSAMAAWGLFWMWRISALKDSTDLTAQMSRILRLLSGGQLLVVAALIVGLWCLFGTPRLNWQDFPGIFHLAPLAGVAGFLCASGPPLLRRLSVQTVTS